MSNIEYQKIELHSAHDLIEEQEIIERERLAAEKLMIDNQIKFSFEIDQKEIKSLNGRNTNVVYVLNLIVRKDDLNKTVELLDKAGDFGYYVDLDDTTDLNEDEEEIIEENPVKISEETLDDFEVKQESSKDLVNLIIKLIYAILFSAILIPEIGWLIFGIKVLNYEVATLMFVFLVIEAPIFVWGYKWLTQFGIKKGK